MSMRDDPATQRHFRYSVVLPPIAPATHASAIDDAGQDSVQAQSSISGIPQIIITDYDNLFYSPSLDLGEAAKTIYTILSKALTFCNGLLNMSIHDLIAIISLQGRNDAISTMCRELNNIAEILTRGRSDWDLLELPEKFFKHVEPVVSGLFKKLERLARYEFCESLREEAVPALKLVRRRLEDIYGEGMRVWRKTRWEFENPIWAIYGD